MGTPEISLLAASIRQARPMSHRRTDQVHIPDLDFLSPEALLAFYHASFSAHTGWRSGQANSNKPEAARRFPTRPYGYVQASGALGRYAYYRALSLNGFKAALWRRRAEAIYLRLPEYAQFRRRGINVSELVKPGEKFRKRPANRTSYRKSS
jgi:hypothetical protein